MKAKEVKGDFEGLPSTIWNRLEIDLKECYNWNGKFQKRKKREVGEEVEEEEVGEEVGQADASNLLNWAKELLPWSVCIERKTFSGFIFFLDISDGFELNGCFPQIIFQGFSAFSRGWLEEEEKGVNEEKK